jgi:hypothetical protein
MFKIHQNLHRDSLKYKEQLSLLSQLIISPEFKVINPRTNSKLNLPWIFKGLKPFWKNLINSLKFHVYGIYLNIIFDWLTCIQILEVSLQVVKNDLVKFIPNISGHLGLFGTLLQLHHWSKLGKECSKSNYKCCSLIRLICIHHLSISMQICSFQKWYSLSQIPSFFLSLEIDSGVSVRTLETITSQTSEFLNICMSEDHVIQNIFSFGSVT